MQSLFVAVLVPEMLVSLFMLNIISAFRQVHLWATVCKTVRPISPYAIDPLSVCPVLSVTFVHCGQTVGQIKMKLGMQVGLGPRHIVLGGDRAPPPFLPPSFHRPPSSLPLSFPPSVYSIRGFAHAAGFAMLMVSS